MNRRILVIDDEEAVRNAFKLALEDSPVTVDVTGSGAAGLELVARRNYDLVYLDLKMPGLNGLETITRLRAINAHVPVYIITAFYPEFLEQLRSETVRNLGFELLRKPIGLDEIVSITMNILDMASNEAKVQGQEMYAFRIYIASPPEGAKAINEGFNGAIKHLLGGDRFTTEIFNVLESPERAVADNILATPTIIRKNPSPEARVTGDCTDMARVLERLGLPGPSPLSEKHPG